jgi:hypothetical protein
VGGVARGWEFPGSYYIGRVYCIRWVVVIDLSHYRERIDE